MTPGPDKPRCGSKKKQGIGTCAHVAGFGTDHLGWGRCRFHGGTSPNGRAFAERERAAAEALKFGIAIETDPHEAMQAIVDIYAGQVAWLNGKVAEIQDDEVLSGEALNPIIRALNSLLEPWRLAAKAAADADVTKRRADLNEMVFVGLSEAMRRAIADVPTLTREQEDELLARLGHHVQALDEIDDWRAPRALAA